MKEKNIELFMGRLGREPELMYTRIGLKPVCHLAVGINDADKTVWKKVVVWGEQAELCKTHLKKGQSVFVQGRIHEASYVDKAGLNKKYLEVRSDLVGFTNL